MEESDDGVPTVLYADDALLVLNKPAGLLAVPGRGADKQDCLTARAQRLYPDSLVVHRLDMATSGLMLMARGIRAQSAMNHAFANRMVKKKYLALVYGILAPAPSGWGVIELPIALDWSDRPRRHVRAEGGKASITRWKVVSPESAGQTRVELEPVTGRSHQLRVHMLAIGHPIMGDMLYGQPASQPAANRLMLHAMQISFAHPVDSRAMQFDCPADF